MQGGIFCYVLRIGQIYMMTGQYGSAADSGSANLGSNPSAPV